MELPKHYTIKGANRVSSVAIYLSFVIAHINWVSEKLRHWPQGWEVDVCIRCESGGVTVLPQPQIKTGMDI